MCALWHLAWVGPLLNPGPAGAAASKLSRLRGLVLYSYMHGIAIIVLRQPGRPFLHLLLALLAV